MLSSWFYFSIEDFAYPLLFLSFFLALFQMAYAESVRGGGGGMVKFLAEHTVKIWAALFLLLGTYILAKMIVTGVGWVKYKLGVTYWLGADISRIDDWVGVGSIIVSIMSLLHNSFRPARDWGESPLR